MGSYWSHTRGQHTRTPPFLCLHFTPANLASLSNNCDNNGDSPSPFKMCFWKMPISSFLFQEFLLKIFCVFRNLMKMSVFPRDWMVMRLLTSK